MQFEQGADDEHAEVDLSTVLALGPCIHCGGVGRPIEPLIKVTRDGVTTIASSELYWTNPFFETIAQALESGSLDVDGAIALLRQDGRPVYTKVADWIEGRQATATVTATMLAGVLAFAGTQMDAGEPTDPGLTEREVVVILEQVLEQYEKTHTDDQQPPVTVDVDVDQSGKGDVDVNVNVEQSP